MVVRSTQLRTFYINNEFLILVLMVILLAKLYPPLGAVYVHPTITASWMAVIFIFFMAGLGLKTNELHKAWQRFGFNALVQTYNFGVVSSIVYFVSRAMLHAETNGVCSGIIVSGDYEWIRF